jgi:hypothetical protein
MLLKDEWGCCYGFHPLTNSPPVKGERIRCSTKGRLRVRVSES